MSPHDSTPHPAPAADRLMARRRVLGTLGMTGLAWAASASPLMAFRSSSMPTVTVGPYADDGLAGLDLPEHWMARNRSAEKYYRFLKTLKLNAVDPKQVVESHAKAKGVVWNTLPPQEWWKRMGYVLKVVDRIAQEMNVAEVEVISAYRAPAYNARCSGAKVGSWHQKNVAVDVKFPVRAYKVASAARELRNLGLFRGGVGGYWNFTHIDARGQNVNW